MEFWILWKTKHVDYYILEMYHAILYEIEGFEGKGRSIAKINGVKNYRVNHLENSSN